MPEITAVVENGQVKLPSDVRLPEGARVRVIWDEGGVGRAPYDRQELTAEDVAAELQWATGKRFPS